MQYNQKLIFIALAFTSLFFTGCSSNKVTFVAVKPANHTESVVYIYRPSLLANLIITPELIHNGVKKMGISNNSYTFMRLPAGKHTFNLKLPERYSGTQSLTINTIPDKTYFLKVSTTLTFAKNKPYGRAFSISHIPSELALNEIQQLKLTDKSQNKTAKKLKPFNAPEGVEDDQFSINKTRNPFSK